MTRIVSIGAQIKQLSGLIGTNDVSEWEDSFLLNMTKRTDDGARTSHLSEKQVETIARLYREHFA